MATALSLPQHAINEESHVSLGLPVRAAHAADSLAECRRYYEHLYGPTRYDSTFGALTVRAHAFRALMVRRALADSAAEMLAQHHTMPIFSVRSDICVLMTAPPTPADDLGRCKADLFRKFVTIVGPGRSWRCRLRATAPGAGCAVSLVIRGCRHITRSSMRCWERAVAETKPGLPEADRVMGPEGGCGIETISWNPAVVDAVRGLTGDVTPCR